MAKAIWAANALTGGTSGCLDDINHASLEDGNIAIVISDSSTNAYFYNYDASSAASESSPDVIKPDSNSGNGRWLLVDIVTDHVDANTIQLGGAGATPNEFSRWYTCW